MPQSPPSYQLIETVFVHRAIAALTSGRDTHLPSLDSVNALLPQTEDDPLIENTLCAAFPTNYDGNSKQEIREMIRSGREKGIGAKRPKSKSITLADKALAAVHDQILCLAHDEKDNCYANIITPEGVRTISTRSSRMKKFIRRAFREEHSRALSKKDVDEVVNELESSAQFDGGLITPRLRTARTQDAIYIDIGDDAGVAIELRGGAWRPVTSPPVTFVRSASMRPLPYPLDGGELEALRCLLGLSGRNWLLFVAFILNAMRPDGPYLCLIISAEQGAGKSFLSYCIKRIIDPTVAEKIRLPKSERDLMIQGQENHLLVFDNVSGVRWDMSDALCALATGSGYVTRKLHTDSEPIVFQMCRPFILNGIGSLTRRPDLLERSIPLKLEPIDIGRRRTEAEMIREFEDMLPRILGAFYTVLASAFQRLEEIDPPTEIRMADAARWLVAAEPALGLAEGTMIDALSGGQRQQEVELLVLDPLVDAVIRAVKDEPFSGMVSALFSLLSTDDHRRVLPRSASALSNALDRMRPACVRNGLHIEFDKHARDGRRVHIEISPTSPLRAMHEEITESSEGGDVEY